MTGDLLDRLVGHALPGGQCVADPAEHRRVCACFGGAPPADGSVHPIYVFVLTQRGVGQTIGEFLDLCDADPADGPMLGECAIDIVHPLRLGARYEVSGEVIDARRKHGRAIGAFDMVTSVIRLARADVEIAACTRVWIFPRRASRRVSS